METHFEIQSRELSHHQKFAQAYLNRWPLKEWTPKQYAAALMHAMYSGAGRSTPFDVPISFSQDGTTASFQLNAIVREILFRLFAKQENPLSLGEFQSNREIGNEFMPAVLRLFQQYANVNLLTNLIYHYWCHEKVGKRVYEVSPGLAVKLRDTELRGLQADDLRLPYEAIYITVPPEADLKIWNEVSGWHQCIGIYAVDDPIGVGSDLDRDQRIDPFIRLDTRMLRLLIVGEDKNKSNSVSKSDDAVFFFALPLKPGTSLDEVIGAMRAMDHEDPNDTVWIEIFRWTMNCIIYATNWDSGEKIWQNKEARQLRDRIKKLSAGKKKSNLARKLNDIDKQERILLGKTIVIDRHVEPGESLSATIPRGPLTVKTRVSGHWRKQPYGPGRQERRLQWIEPFWRGIGQQEREESSKHKLK